MNKALYREIAALIGARSRCEKSASHNEWFNRHTERLEWIAKNVLPRGSGIDNGTQIDLGLSTEEKIVLRTAYHHMNEGGMYDGWTEHTITIRPSLQSNFTMTFSGRNRNEIKDYLHQEYEYVLSADFDNSVLADI